MRENNEDRILITGSIAGSYQTVYNASKAFLDSFAFALRNELKDTDVTVTCLMPGATETKFFDRAAGPGTEVIAPSSTRDSTRTSSVRLRQKYSGSATMSQTVGDFIVERMHGACGKSSAIPATGSMAGWAA
jgi:short-subunit dehydrogenase